MLLASRHYQQQGHIRPPCSLIADPRFHVGMQVAAQREPVIPSVLTVWLANPRPEQQLLYRNNDKEKPSVGRRQRLIWL